jgi:hypothetical protein
MSDALVAALMGNRQRRDPFGERRRYGATLMQQGASTAPVQSWGEGLARALQGGLGGYFSRQADQDEEARDRKTMEGLAKALGARSQEEMAATLQSSGLDPALMAPIIGQMLVRRQEQMKAADDAVKWRATNTPPGMQPAPAPGPGAITSQPLPPVGNAALDNNVGNIRATNIAWDGKGPAANGFETFATPQQGANAQANNFRAYVQANPGMTVAQAIAKWSPPNENDTNGVIRSLAEATGINPGMPLGELMKDQAAFATLLDAQARLEKGKMPEGFTADTFMTAAGPAPGPQAAPANIVQTQAQAPVQSPPLPPDVTRPQPTRDQLERYGKMIEDRQMTPAQARAALDAELDREWGVQRERQKLEYDRQSRDFDYNRKRTDEKNDPKFTEDNNKAHAYALRISKALPLLEQMGSEPEGFPSRVDRAATNLPVLGNTLAGPRGEKFDQLQRDIINAILRRESGAVISDAEFDNARKQYIPQPGDSPETVKLKMENIRTQLKAFADTANRPPEVYGMTGQRGTTTAPAPQVAPAGPQPGTVEGGYRFKGGDPSKKENWERAQ